jgi:hypothetical protein
MTKPFKPGGHKGKLHRELGIPEGEKIPHSRLESAMHSSDPEVKRDAIRANTMEHWHHGGHAGHRGHGFGGAKVK